VSHAFFVSSSGTIAALASLIVWSLAGCGYTLQTSKNPVLEARGIRRVFIKPLINDTYKPGVENIVYNELLRTLAAGNVVRLVSRIEDADAVMSGKITGAGYTSAGNTTADQLFNQDPRASKDIFIASEYQAVLNCEFALVRFKPETSPTPVAPSTLWSQSFVRVKRFPANNQLGVFGTTAPLINESEFDRALREMAQSMTGDLHEAMLAIF